MTAMLRLTRVLMWLTVCAAVATPTGVRAQRLDKETQQNQPAGWLFTPSFGFGGAWDDNILMSGPGVTPWRTTGRPSTRTSLWTTVVAN
jgi:hypothetical protein